MAGMRWRLRCRVCDTRYEAVHRGGHVFFGRRTKAGTFRLDASCPGCGLMRPQPMSIEDFGDKLGRENGPDDGVICLADEPPPSPEPRPRTPLERALDAIRRMVRG